MSESRHSRIEWTSYAEKDPVGDSDSGEKIDRGSYVKTYGPTCSHLLGGSLIKP